MKKMILAAAIVAAGCLAAGPSWSAEKEDGMRGDRKGKMERGRGDMSGRMALAMSMRLGDALKLDEAATLKLYHSIKKHQESGKAGREKAKAAHKELADAVKNEEKSDAKLKELIGKVESARDAARAEHQKMVGDLKSQLTVAQQAKLVVALPAIHKQLAGMMRMAKMAQGMGRMRGTLRRQHGGMGGPGAMGGPGMGSPHDGMNPGELAAEPDMEWDAFEEEDGGDAAD